MAQGTPRNHGEWMEHFRRRASLDPFRAVLDGADEVGLKNSWIDFLERRGIRRALGGKTYHVALDLGCGVGRLTDLLAKSAERVLALDASEALLAVARRRGLPHGADAIRADLRSLPLRDCSVDLVATSNVLIYLVEDADLATAAREAARVLRPGGQVLLLEHLAPGARTEKREGIAYRSLGDVAAVFGGAGFLLQRNQVVRKSPSRVLHWVLQGRIPGPFWGLAAGLESLLAVRGRVLPDYRDHLLVFSR